MDDDTQAPEPNTGDSQTEDTNPQSPGTPPVFNEEVSSLASNGDENSSGSGLTPEPFPVAEGSEEPAESQDDEGTSDAPDAPGPAQADESTPAEQI